MDTMIFEILKEFGLPILPSALLYLVINRATEQRVEQRNTELQILKSQLETLRESLTKHISFHKDKEASLCGKIEAVHQRINKLDDKLKSCLQRCKQDGRIFRGKKKI